MEDMSAFINEYLQDTLFVPSTLAPPFDEDHLASPPPSTLSSATVEPQRAPPTTTANTLGQNQLGRRPSANGMRLFVCVCVRVCVYMCVCTCTYQLKFIICFVIL